VWFEGLEAEPMGYSRRQHKAKRQHSPVTLETLEGRELLSIAPYLYAAQAAQEFARLKATDVAASPASNGVPTPHELARQRFTASYTGQVLFGPGRTTAQLSQAFFVGAMTSSAFLHGNLVMSVITPIDPTQSVTGQAALIVRNVSNSGNELILDLQGGPPSATTPPTHLTWTVNGSSGGAFTNATGQGTVDIRYRRFTHPTASGTQAAVATVVFRGLLDTTGLNNVLRF
jgi:hypothetical protein